MCKIYILSESLSLEIAADDLTEMTWQEARDYTLIVRDKWRLPTKEELNEMYRLHLKAVGEFRFENYWSSEGNSNFNAFSKSFSNGKWVDSISKSAPKYLSRLVRNF